MKVAANIKRALFDLFPRRGPALVGLLIVTVVAFSLGLVFSGGGEAPSGPESAEQNRAEKTSKPTIWTCSMHPQIRLPNPGKCPICFMDLIPLESGGGETLDPRQIQMSATAKELAQIETAVVRRGFAEAEVRMVGKIAYDETNVAYITAWVPGRLDRLYADFTGITVKKGDHLVYIYSPELLAAQEELLQAKIAVEALSKTRSTILNNTAVATLDAAREKLRLFGLTEQQIAAVEAEKKPADHLTINAPIGGVVVHKNALEGMYVKTGTRIYTLADLTRLWVVFEAYESDLPWLRYGQHVSFTTPSFPGETFTGIVSFIDPVVDPKKRTVKVRAIVDNNSRRLKPNMFVSAVVQSKLDNNGKVVDEDLAGKWIGPMHPEVVKNGPGTCDICGMALVPAESLGYAGEPATKENAPLLIPVSAPLVTGKRAVVYVEVPNTDEPVFEGREVELGPRAGDFYVVTAGLSEGESVVVNGAFKIDAELQIQAKPSLMSPEGGGKVMNHGGGQMGSAATDAESVDQPVVPQNGKVKIDAAARDALSPIYKTYFEVQMALAADDLKAATTAYATLQKDAELVDMEVFRGEGHVRWMKFAAEIKKYTTAGAAAKDLKDARAAFYDLSRSIIQAQETFGHSDNRNYFLTFCPMANANKGAYWLQTVDTVYNSFYGPSMLRCGEIKQALAAEPQGAK